MITITATMIIITIIMTTKTIMTKNNHNGDDDNDLFQALLIFNPQKDVTRLYITGIMVVRFQWKQTSLV